jgi:hypothetical protein
MYKQIPTSPCKGYLSKENPKTQGSMKIRRTTIALNVS